MLDVEIRPDATSFGQETQPTLFKYLTMLNSDRRLCDFLSRWAISILIRYVRQLDMPTSTSLFLPMLSDSKLYFPSIFNDLFVHRSPHSYNGKLTISEFGKLILRAVRPIIDLTVFFTLNITFFNLVPPNKTQCIVYGIFQ